MRFVAVTVTSIGISADGNTAWVAGMGGHNVPFLLYVVGVDIVGSHRLTSAP